MEVSSTQRGEDCLSCFKNSLRTRRITLRGYRPGVSTDLVNRRNNWLLERAVVGGVRPEYDNSSTQGDRGPPVGDLIQKNSREVIETGAETSSENIRRAERHRPEQSHLFV